MLRHLLAGQARGGGAAWISARRSPPSPRSAVTPLCPCHKTAHPEDFNCLFCYCPLYTLGDQCGGNFAYIGDGIKDCSNCLLPHGRGSYSYVTGKFGELAELAKKNRKQQ